MSETIDPIMWAYVDSFEWQMKLRPEFKERWLKALLSGEYEQTQKTLRGRSSSGGDGFCCLGVACDVFKKEIGGDWAGSVFEVGRNQWDTMPDEELMQLAFDSTEGEDWDDDAYNLAQDAFDRLAGCNDGSTDESRRGMTFEEIATVIKEKL